MFAPTPNSPVRCSAPPTYLWLKDRVDRYIGLVVLVTMAPLLALIWWLIRRDSPGPVIFRQVRAGRGGHPFTLWKFRTMRCGVDSFGDSPQDGTDPRLTRVGRFLRETSLDELPQLWNVVRGEMSLVGPRPLYLQQMAEWDERQRGRLLVKPGLTGLAQTRGRGSLTIEEKLEWDVRYVERISLATDLEILGATVVGLFRRKNIYERRYSHDRVRRSGTATTPDRPG